MVQRRVHSEATVWSNFFDVVEVDPKWRSVPYGNPIWNHQHLSSMGVETVRMLAQVAIGNWNSRNNSGPAPRYYVLDESGRSATVALPGMAGQLYIAGEGGRGMAA